MKPYPRVVTVEAKVLESEQQTLIGSAVGDRVNLWLERTGDGVRVYRIGGEALQGRGQVGWFAAELLPNYGLHLHPEYCGWHKTATMVDIRTGVMVLDVTIPTQDELKTTLERIAIARAEGEARQAKKLTMKGGAASPKI